MTPDDHGSTSCSLELASGQTVRFRYRNWRGVVAVRSARVLRLIYGATEWHPEPQWLLEAVDLDKDEVRLFALADMVPSR